MAPRNATRSRPKDAIAMLHADHQKVRQLFRAYRTAKDQAMQWEIALHIFDDLRREFPHATIMTINLAALLEALDEVGERQDV